MSNLRSSILALVVPVSCLLVWWIACESGAVDPLFLASPLAVGSSLAELLREGSVLQAAAATVARALTAFGLAVAIGAPLGVLVGRSRALQLLLTPAVDFARSIPATAFFPLFMLLFGIGDTSKVAVAFYASALIFFVYVVSASRQITADRLACAKLLGASRLDLL
ncbi:MAG: ABC transporter permease subunit, partial [Nitrospirae bacterium]|nr:ABC transporter permease subunit [Fimbriimonadaceae bacterium]